MARKFIIFFHAHEGSSAIVSHLGRHDEVSVPIFEQLDYYQISKKIDVTAIEAGTHIPGVIDRLFMGHDFETALTSDAGAAPASAAACIGFKWRTCGPVAPLIPVLQKHDVILFHIFRADVLQRIASFYFSSQVIHTVPALEEFNFHEAPGHPQFVLAKLDAAQRAKVAEIVSDVTFEMPLDHARAEIEKLLQHKDGIEQSYMQPCAAAGLETYHMVYEDYVTRKDAFLQAHFTKLGVSADLQGLIDSHFKKFAPDNVVSRLSNRSEIEEDSVFSQAAQAFERLVHTRPNLMTAV